MIVSHTHKFVFFAVPKTATHTIRQALEAYLGENDWEQKALFGRKIAPIPEIAALQHGHVSVTQIRPHFSDADWQNYFKFGFVRNPYDRYVSTCFFLNRNNPGFAFGANAYMKQAINRPEFRQRILAVPQSVLLTDADGSIAVDYVGRYESLQESFDHICQKIGIPSTDLGVKNSSEHANYVDYYDDELVRVVSRFYDSDFDNFQYPIEALNRY